MESDPATKNNLPETVKLKTLKDLRVYCAGFAETALLPYDYLYTQIFLNLLSKQGPIFPGFHRIYIATGYTLEECQQLLHYTEPGCVVGHSPINYADYVLQPDSVKSQMVFQLTNTLIKINSGDSLEADAWLENKPRSMVFDIKQILAS